MKFAIISDIHSNLAALQSVLKRAEELKCDDIVCLGDIVGYGPYPNECCKIVQETTKLTVVGNHDHASIGYTDIDYFNKFAKEAIIWTSQVLNENNKEYLKSLPSFLRIENIFCVHASPTTPLEWNYIISLYDAIDNFNSFEEKICFIGHSHVPVAYSYEEIPSYETSEKIQLLDGFRYIINVGSVGQPRDRNPNACFGIYDNDLNLFQLQRVAYDIRATQKAMRNANLPEFLVERLLFGR